MCVSLVYFPLFSVSKIASQINKRETKFDKITSDTVIIHVIDLCMFFFNINCTYFDFKYNFYCSYTLFEKTQSSRNTFRDLTFTIF